MHSFLLLLQCTVAIMLATIPSFKNMGDEIYIGVDNILQIDLNDCDPNDINIKTTSGSLIKRNDSTYSIVVQIPEDEIKVKLYYKKIVCQIKTLKAERLPNPQIKMEGSSTTFSKSSANQSGKLSIEYPAKYTNIGKSNIISFNVSIQDPSGRPVFSTYTRGDALDNNTINMIKKVQVGSKLLINNIITQSASLGATQVPTSLNISIIE